MNYRKYYREKLEVNLDSSFVVHHIDGNRQNNDILNLVALPKRLHLKYHNQKAKYDFVVNSINEWNYFFKCEYKKYFSAIELFMDVKNEVAEYILIRDNILHNKYGNRLD